jgi:hypothetical protein
MAGGKTVRPGHQNTMSRGEVKDFAKQHGIDYPG